MRRIALFSGIILTIMFLIILTACADVSFFVVTYDTNGHGGSISPQSKNAGEDLILTTSKPGQVGYNFCGWATTPDAEEAEYLPGDTYSQDAELKLYAIWKEINIGEVDGFGTFEVPQYPINGQGIYVSFTVSRDAMYRIRSINHSLATATAIGTIRVYCINPYWSTVSDGSYIRDGENPWDPVLDIEVTAQLEAGKTYSIYFNCPPNAVQLEISDFQTAGIYTVTYDTNGHGESVSPQSKNAGEDLILTSSKPGQVGYNFYGWATTPDADEAEYLPGDTYSQDADLKLYAIWKEINIGEVDGFGTFEVPQYPINGQGIYVSFAVSRDDTYRIRSLNHSLATATTIGSICVYCIKPYWSIVSDGSYIRDGENPWDPVLDFEVTAQLKAGRTYAIYFNCPPNVVQLEIADSQTAGIYTVTYDTNGHGESVSPQSKNAGEDLILTASKPGQVGYNFCGWATTPDADEAEYLPGDTYSQDADLKLYAIWKEINIGEVDGFGTFEVPQYPINGQGIYVSFAVSRDDTYRIRSLNHSLATATTIGTIRVYCINPYWSTVSDGSYIRDGENPWDPVLDFEVTAQLKAGRTYAIYFNCPPNAVQLLIEPQISEIVAENHLKLPKNLVVIESEAFSETSIVSIEIPVSVKTIQAGAFSGCTNLRMIIIYSADAEIDDDAFTGCSDIHFYAPPNSTTQEFADNHGYAFSAISGER